MLEGQYRRSATNMLVEVRVRTKHASMDRLKYVAVPRSTQWIGIAQGDRYLVYPSRYNVVDFACVALYKPSAQLCDATRYRLIHSWCVLLRIVDSTTHEGTSTGIES